MIVDTNSHEMRWILIKFLKDSMQFLSSETAKGMIRGKWVDIWITMCLSEENIKE